MGKLYFTFTIHPLADLLYTYQELFNFVVRQTPAGYVSMKIQLTVVCVGVYSKAMSMSNSHYIRTIGQEKYWPKNAALWYAAY